MFGVHARLGRLVFLGLGLILGSTAIADAPRGNNPLDQAKRLNDVAAQKVEADVRAAVLDSQRLAASDTAKALDRLKRARTQLEADTALTAARRDSLKKMLEGRIRTLEAGPDKNPLTEKEVQSKIRPYEPAKKDAEAENIQSDVKAILELQKAGKLTEARRLSEELARKYPSNPAAAAAVRTTSAFDQLASARDVRTDKEQRTTNVIRDIEKSALPPTGDIEFPKDFKARTKGRTSGVVPLSPKEKAIMTALRSPVTVNFKEERFQEVMEYLATVMGQPILLDRNALNEAQINYETPISLSVKGVTARTVLRKILGDFGLTYIVKDEAIQVTTLAKARETMIVRSYYLGDLLGVGGGPGDPLTNIFGPNLGRAQAMQNIANIIDMIQTTVDPQSWHTNGGPGSLFFYYPTMSLVVKQSAEVHAMLTGFGR